MKYLSKIFTLLSVGLFLTACTEMKPGEEKALELSTPIVSDVSSTSVVVTTNISGEAIVSRGVCYATSPNPTINDTKVLAERSNMRLILSGLAIQTTYYARAFVQTYNNLIYSNEVSFTTLKVPSIDDDPQIEGPSALKRVVVHDPSVVFDPNTSTYYIFGSHRAAAKCSNMMSWTAFTAPWATESSTNASNADAFTTPQVTKVKKGNTEYDFVFDAMAWAKKGSASYNIDGNMWAPDVIWNPTMKKWCMYLSINGENWYSSIILLTADNITGPYRYQAPVVISGFYSGSNYKSTDLEVVLGEQASLPERYKAPWAANNKPSYPNAIDPCVFYDEAGKLWMSYGSWSGGIFMLELDEKTGLRDYDVTYAENSTSDPYFGKKIAGGFYVSGEASYIEYIGGYYYLFMSYGFFNASTGYQMRVFRSANPDGPYVDSKNDAALVPQHYMNYGPTANDGNRGVNIFGAYGEWGYQTVGDYSERAQGHNSIIAAPDGRTYLVYHTRFQGLGEGHQVRVHQVYQNEEGWLVAAPFEYTGEGVKSAAIGSVQKVATSDIPGKYKLLTHRYKLNHEAKELCTPVEVTLNADGTISGAQTGTWSVKEGTSYVNITLDKTYKGVMVWQTLEPKDEKAPCFTGLDSSTGVTVWAYKFAN